MLFDKLTAMSLLSLFTTSVMVRIRLDKLSAMSLLSLFTTSVMVQICYLIYLQLCHC